MSSPADQGTGRLGFGIALGAMVAAVWLPLSAVEYLPLVDLPNHLARLRVLTHPHDPMLSRFYAIDWAFVPNLGMELFALALAPLLGVAATAKAFVAVTFLVMITGTVFLSRQVHGRATVVSLAAGVGVYNYALNLGMLNFLLATGLAVWAFAFHLKLLDRPPWLRLVAGALWAMLILVVHLYGLAVLAVLVGVHGLIQVGAARGNGQNWAWRIRELAVRAAPFVPAIGVWWAFAPKAVTARAVSFPDLGQKLLNLAHLSFFDAPPAGLAVLAAIAAFFGWLAVRRQAVMPPPFVPLMFVMLGLYVAIPPEPMLSSNADWRLLVPMALVAAAAVKEPFQGRRARGVLAGVMVLMAAVQAGAVHAQWTRADVHQRHMIDMLGAVSPGSRVFSAVLGGDFAKVQSPVPWPHMAALGAVEHGHFLPSLFAFKTQQILTFKPPFDAIARRHARVLYNDPAAIDWADVAKTFDYVLLMDHRPEAANWVAHVPVPVRVVDATNPHMVLLAIKVGQARAVR